MSDPQPVNLHLIPLEKMLPPRTFLRIDASGPDYIWIVLSVAEKAYLASHYFVEPARIFTLNELRSCWEADRPLNLATVEQAFVCWDPLELSRFTAPRPPKEN